MLAKVILLWTVLGASAWTSEIESECPDTIEDSLQITAIPLSFNNGSVRCFKFGKVKGQVKLTDWSWSGGQLKHPLDAHNSIQFFDSKEQLIAKIPVSQLPQQLTFSLLPNKQIYVYGNVTSGHLTTYISDVSQAQPATETSMIYTSDGSDNPTYINYPEDEYPFGFHLTYALTGNSVCIEYVNLLQSSDCKSSYMRLQIANASIDLSLCGSVVRDNNAKKECVRYWEFSFSPVRIEFFSENIPEITAKYRGVRVKVDTTMPTTSSECPSGAGAEYGGVSIQPTQAMTNQGSHGTCPKYFNLNEGSSRCVLNCQECANDMCSDSGHCVYENSKPEMTCRCTVGCRDGPNCTMSAACIAGIVIGCLIGLLLLILLIFCIIRVVRASKKLDEVDQQIDNVTGVSVVPLPIRTPVSALDSTDTSAQESRASIASVSGTTSAPPQGS